MAQCSTTEYENFQSLSSLFEEKPIFDNILETQSRDLDDQYLSLLTKEFQRYFQVSEYYLDINLFGHKLRVEQDNDGRVAKQYRFRYAEYQYSVGSQYVKMFRSQEENTGKIHSIKIATLQFSKPETYFSFLSCIKEAMLQNQLDKMSSHLLGLEGYFFRRKKSQKFWETEIQLVMILDDHDMTLQDLMRARRALGNPWTQEQILQIITNIQTMIDYVEENAGVGIVGANPLNIQYSKRKDSLILGNLQNILSGRELKQINSEKFSNHELNKIEKFFNRVFPDVKDLYENKDTTIKESNSNYSVSIIAQQMAEILFNHESTINNKEEFEKNMKNLATKHTNINELLHMLSQKYKGEHVKFGYLSVMGGRESFNDNLVNSLRISIAKNTKPFKSVNLSNPNSTTKISEVNTSNGWKKLQRNLEPNFDWKKKLYESEFFESFGRNRSSLESCRHVIQVYNKVEQLDKKSWALILEKLVEYFLSNDQKDDASNHAKTILGLIETGPTMESMIYSLSIATIVNLSFSLKNHSSIKDKLSPTLQKSSLGYIQNQHFRQNEDLLKSDSINATISQDPCQFNRRNLEFLTKGYSNFAIEQINSNFDSIDSKVSNEIKRQIFKNNSAVANFASGKVGIANSIMSEIEAPSKKIFETDKYRKMDIVDINNNIAVFALGQTDYTLGIKQLKINQDLARELVCTSHKSLLVLTNNLAVAYYQKGDYNNSQMIIKLLFSNFREKWVIGKHTNPAYVLNYIMILTKNDILTDAKTMNKKLVEFIENNNVATDFKIKVIRHSVIMYSKLGKGPKALYFIGRYYELANEYMTSQNSKNKNTENVNNDGILSEVKIQMGFMKRVKAIVLFKMGNKGDAMKQQRSRV